MATKTYAQWRQEKLSDPERAARYLNAAKRDSKEAFQHAVLNVIQAHKVAKVAKSVGVARESFYRSFGPEGNPALYTFDAVMKLLHIDIEFKPASTGGVPKQKAQKPKSRAVSFRGRRPGSASAYASFVSGLSDSTLAQAAKSVGSNPTTWTATSYTNALLPFPLEQQSNPHTALGTDLLNLVSSSRRYELGLQNTATISQEYNRVQ
jgi:probable addiction module antidote protein